MKTALTKEINGKTIIIGFSDPIIDPVETEKIIIPLLDDTDEVKRIKTKTKEIGERQRMSRLAIVEALKYRRSGNNQKAEEKERECKNHNDQIVQLMTELKPLKEPLKKKRNNLVRENAIYFQPKPCEKIITIGQYDKLKEKEIGEFGKLTIAGKVIPDYSGQMVYQKTNNRWNIIYLELGDRLPTEVILERDLSDEQKLEIAEQAEVDRIDGLSQGEKDAEKETAIAAIAYQAANMRSALEIQGDPDALQKAQEWYNEQLLLIEVKYN